MEFFDTTTRARGRRARACVLMQNHAVKANSFTASFGRKKQEKHPQSR